MSIKLQPVESTNIAQVGHCDKTSTLAVQFKAAEETFYLFLGVPVSIYEEMMESESLGTYFAKNIKTKYLNTKLKV